MAFTDSNPRIFVSVAEQSADEHAASLIRAYLEASPKAAFAGLAGPAMRDVGCECFQDMTAGSAMAAAAVRRAPEAWLLLRRLKRYLRSRQFDAAVLVDSPALNLPIAKVCRKAGLPVLYYIAPQTWAWGGWRVNKIRSRVERLACIWPFEEAYFREKGLRAEYVGHPSLDRLMATRIDEGVVARVRQDAPMVVGLLPGSRGHVVQEVLPGQLEAARMLSLRFRKARFFLMPANREVQQEAQGQIKRKGLRIPLEVLDPEMDKASALRAADLVLAASGTITLEVMYHRVPMIVMYNASRILYHLVGRWVIRTPYLSLPNILAGREIVPEYMPFYRSVDPIVACAVELLSTPTSLERMRNDLQQTLAPMMKPGAARRTAEILREMTGR